MVTSWLEVMRQPPTPPAVQIAMETTQVTMAPPHPAKSQRRSGIAYLLVVRRHRIAGCLLNLAIRTLLQVNPGHALIQKELKC
jgi:hypothetical protein